MNEIARRDSAELERLTNLAAEARAYSEGLALNMFQLGRVFTEAKKLVEHGEWTEWIRQNAGMSERSAQQLMAIYARFGSKPAFASIEKSKLFKMLSLPDGAEDEFVTENDVADMTSREVEEAVRKARDEAQAEIDRERAARELAEHRARVLEERPPEIPEEIGETIRQKDELLEKYKTEMDRVASVAQETLDSHRNAVTENNSLRRELKETEEMLAEKQREYDALQAELLNTQSAIAKGDAERVIGEELTLDEFASAVRQFIGTVARMPHMGGAFATMHQTDRYEFDTLLKTVESWAAGSRAAMNTIEGGPIYVGE